MFKKVFEYAGEYKAYTYRAIVYILLGIAFSIIPYFCVYKIVNALLQNQEITMPYLTALIGTALISLLLYAVLNVKGLQQSHIAAYNTLKNLRISLQGKLEKLPLGTIEEVGTGSIKKMFIDDIETLELLLAHAIPEGIGNLCVPVVIYIVLFAVDWKLALLSMATLPLGILAMAIMFAIGNKDMNHYYMAAQKMNNTIIEYVNGMEVVKVFNRDGESYEKYENSVTNYRDFTLAWFKACWPWMAIYSSLIPCIAFLTLPVGAYLVLQGYSTLSNLVLVLCLTFAIGGPILHALSFAGKFPQLIYKIEELEKMMGAAPLKQSEEGFHGKDYTIDFHQVSFAYKEEEVIHQISLHINPGTMNAFVGESGSGKSTLAKLLVHFYDVGQGSVSIGGQNIAEMSIEALGDQISYVSQEQFLFNMSLLENIRLGKKNATDAEVLEAAHKAQCDEFLNRIEGGIMAMAGDSGKQLSGGERQRISLARAILKDAPIIVLDEATAFMDPENEEKMNQAIAEVIKDKTVIVIAHRLHSIVNADCIFVLKNGRLDASGTHQELLEESGEYNKLWKIAETSANWHVSTGGEQ
ncbi:ABC transporter ATP-binding protein [Hespellia stercorisuis]|uniref:ATP-binding cassette, subfamily B n=1 Tax=Hespellia stercorisuis DSM 15480 TaxID=1121950 RepID=A0A1M6IC20_9FIRM|nr:ABC transporter ATP-binding protein [Hespellia stercorisuis]SHJ31965.1 ATP-binding cassette, subfamily B [Hespellia stercorisuis DSM 15480]